jgi:hypothetical protein
MANSKKCSADFESGVHDFLSSLLEQIQYFFHNLSLKSIKRCGFLSGFQIQTYSYLVTPNIFLLLSLVLLEVQQVSILHLLEIIKSKFDPP